MASHLNRQRVRFTRRPATCGAVLLLALAAGCGHPSQANIDLRRQNAELTSQVDKLKLQHDADLATIRGIQDRTGVLPTLPQERMAKLFTVGSMKITKLTGGFDLNHDGGVDTGVRAYVQLFDNTGDLLKAAGTFTVEVFDLSDSAKPLVGKRTFPVEQADEFWYPMPLIYSFVLPVPWSTPPKHGELTVRVTYVDELTQRVLTGEMPIHAKLAAATTTRPN